ncbi:MAG TPA: GWxTD domain-containing protein [Cyclobacteriaceae bacterium]|nr:GWxTD domain-containing protein [Cyclobacteriaceae bacterium]
MIKRKTTTLGLLVGSMLLLWATSLPAQTSLKDINQNLRYSRYSRLALKVIPVKVSERNFKLQMVAEKLEEDPRFDDYQFSYTIVEGFDEVITDEERIVLQGPDLKKDTESHYYFEETVEIPAGQEQAYAIFWARDKRQGDEYVFHTDLLSPYIFEVPDFGAYYGNNLPFDQTYLNAGEALLFNSTNTVNLYSYFYPQEFSVPLPPMETKPPAVPKEVSVVDDGSFLVNVPKTFGEEGYYFIQSDTTSSSGLLIKTVPKSFPNVPSWDEMVEMVAYISTRKEHEQLMAAENKKLALDQYWIQMVKDEEQAKALIREYFRQVEFANILFSDFKEGWMTDRGMIYIVMGPPQEVYFHSDREVWVYDGINSNSKISFTFARIKNILTPNYYVLNRSRSYQPVWFKNITLWRSGSMAF